MKNRDYTGCRWEWTMRGVACKKYGDGCDGVKPTWDRVGMGKNTGMVRELGWILIPCHSLVTARLFHSTTERLWLCGGWAMCAHYIRQVWHTQRLWSGDGSHSVCLQMMINKNVCAPDGRHGKKGQSRNLEIRVNAAIRW